MSATNALVAGWIVIATRVFSTPTALWLAFGGGVAHTSTGELTAAGS